jgi:tRNA pseudouridine38-40 synthase
VRVLKLVVAYDGTGFHGWQRQPGPRTVQGVLEEVLSRALQEPVSLQGAGRTDAGVHARGQVASFETESRLPVTAVPPLANRSLPDDVRVCSAAEVTAGFDARRSARARRYAYRLLDRDDVLLGRIAWHPRGAVSGPALARATAVIEGEHDCSSFRSSGGSETTPCCRISRASWRRWEGGLQLDIVSNHFLYHMVRSVVGTALEAARAADPAATMRAILQARDRRRAGVTAPPQGLCLEQVFYDPMESVP